MRRITLLLWFVFTAALIFLPPISFSQADQNTPKNIVEIARVQRKASEEFAAISKELNQDLIRIECYLYEDKTPCANFVRDIKSQTALQSDFKETLLGEVLILDYQYSNGVCWAYDGKLHADPRKGPAAIISCLRSDQTNKTKENFSQDKVKNIEKEENISPEKLRELEKKFRILAEKIFFAVGVDSTNSSKYSHSAFVMNYTMDKKRVPFLITAGHVAGHFDFDASKIYIFAKGHKESIAFNGIFRTSEVLDIAVIKVPLEKINILTGIPRTDALPAQTPIAVLCNPFYFGIPIRTGFFLSVDRTDQSLSLEFPGIGVEGGCSGSPVIDEEGRIIGLLVRGTQSGRIAFAIPIERVLKFIQEEFR